MEHVYFIIGFIGVTQISLFIGLAVTWTELRAMKMSTHQISWINPLNKEDQQFQEITDDVKKELGKDRVLDNVL